MRSARSRFRWRTFLRGRDSQGSIAERDENTCRLDFTPSEKTAIAKRLNGRAKAEAKARQKDHGKTAPGRKKEDTGGNLPQVSGKARDQIAKAVGLSGRTLKKQLAVFDPAN